MRLKLSLNHIFITGLVIGVSAAAAQAYLQAQPPVAYGICLLGHPRDFTAWIMNGVFGTNWRIHEAFVLFPTLLVVGVLVGSFTAAYRNKELRLRPGPVDKKFHAFLFGFLVVNLGLLWVSCPIRTTLLASYGSIMAVVVLFSIVIGVLLAIAYVRFRVKKETF